MCPGASDAEVLEALRRAACDGLLARAPQGLDTVIGEAGVKVSGGERQRLSIARALLRNPDLLVFDEATSSLDSITEDEISQTIRDVNHSREAITILIAHRLSTVLHADRIYVLERGRIVEQGRHDDLVAQQGCITRCGASRSANAARSRWRHAVSGSKRHPERTAAVARCGCRPRRECVARSRDATRDTTPTTTPDMAALRMPSSWVTLANRARPRQAGCRRAV